MLKRLLLLLAIASLMCAALGMRAQDTFARPITQLGAAQVVTLEPETSMQPVASPISAHPEAGIETSPAVNESLVGRWGIEHISAPAAWEAMSSLAPVLVAVLDTGIADDAPFADRVIGGSDLTGAGTLVDEHGHGTHMAGTIAAIAPNATFLNLKVADKRGRCSTGDVAEAIRLAADRGAQVINISLEVAPSSALEEAIAYAWDKGALIVVAAGNSGSTEPAYPAAYPLALAVAGTNENDDLAVLSNHGDWVDIAAPGNKIYAERPAGEFGYETGTSPAAAHVSGVAALLFGLAGDTSGNGLMNDEVRDAIEATATPIALESTGSGIVNAFAAVQLLAA